MRMPGVEPFRIGYGEAVCESVPTSLDSSASFASRSAVASWAADSEALCVGNSHSNGGCQSMARRARRACRVLWACAYLSDAGKRRIDHARVVRGGDEERRPLRLLQPKGRFELDHEDRVLRPREGIGPPALVARRKVEE